MMFRTSMIMRTGAETGHGDLINLSVTGGLLDGEESTRFLALTLEFLK